MQIIKTTTALNAAKTQISRHDVLIRIIFNAKPKFDKFILEKKDKSSRKHGRFVMIEIGTVWVLQVIKLYIHK